MAKDGLCETLDMTPIEDEIDSIEVGDSIELEDIVKYAMEIFQDSMNGSKFAEPLERLAAQELALNALKSAQDALVKKNELRLKERKQELDEYKEISKKDENVKLGNESRAEILNRLKKEQESA